MSGYNDFSSWIDRSAKYVLMDGKRVKIISTYFTTDPSGCHNSDELVVVLEGHKEHFHPFHPRNVKAFKDLSARYDAQMKKKKA